MTSFAQIPQAPRNTAVSSFEVLQNPRRVAWGRLEAEIAQLDQLLGDAERAARWNEGVIPAAFERWIAARFGDFAATLHAVLGDASELDVEAREELGRRVQAAVIPRLETSELASRMYHKPRGYAGDYGTIELMYREAPTGTDALGVVLDRVLRTQPACRAVVNRRGLLAEEIAATIAAAQGRPARITSLACGPAAEVFDAFAGHAPDRLRATCIDIDVQALDFVAERSAREGLAACFDLHRGNLVHLAFGRQTIDLEPQDLMYSIGLIDYFSDKFVIRLLDWIHDQLRPGGRVVLGNFHPANPSRELMEHVFEWDLIHRDEAEMHALFAASKFGTGCTDIRYEGEGINLFAACVRP